MSSPLTAVSNLLNRALRDGRKNATRLRRRIYHRGRYTRAGRALLAVSDFVMSPGDAVARRNVGASYNRQHPGGRMDREKGYAILPAGSLPGTNDIVALALRLFDEKRRKIEAGAGPDTELHAKKWAFLRSVLTNRDLAQHP